MSKLNPPMMRVQIGGDVVRRIGQLEILERDVDGRPTVSHMRPAIYPGEFLVERLGTFPAIIKDTP